MDQQRKLISFTAHENRMRSSCTEPILTQASLVTMRRLLVAYIIGIAAQRRNEARLQATGPRVLKQNRGYGGQGVWKAELVSAFAHNRAIVRVLHARRDSVLEEMPLGDFMNWEPNFLTPIFFVVVVFPTFLNAAYGTD
jgi:hypothetical protein